MDDVKARRKALGWDRATLAHRAGMDKAVVALVERGLWDEDEALTRLAYVLSEAESGNVNVQLAPPTIPEPN